MPDLPVTARLTTGTICVVPDSPQGKPAGELQPGDVLGDVPAEGWPLGDSYGRGLVISVDRLSDDEVWVTIEMLDTGRIKCGRRWRASDVVAVLPQATGAP